MSKTSFDVAVPQCLGVQDFELLMERRTKADRQVPLSSADYWDDTEECDDAFVKPRLKSISLKIDPGLLNKVKIIANKRGLSYNAMIRYILSKGIDRELKDL